MFYHAAPPVKLYLLAPQKEADKSKENDKNRKKLMRDKVNDEKRTFKNRGQKKKKSKAREP